MKKNSFIYGMLTGAGAVLFVVLMVIAGRLMVTAFSDNRLIQQGTSEGSGEKMENSQELEISDELVQKKLSLLQQYIERFYLDTTKTGSSADKMEDGIYQGYISGLGDPYSVYYNEEEYDSLQTSTQGDYCGIGATVSQDPSTGIITIVKPFEGAPAAEAGLEAGDILYTIEKEEVTGQDLTSVVTKLKGKKNTKVHIQVVREGESEPIDFTITRKEVEVPTITYKMLSDQIGYIQVESFDVVTKKQFRSAVDDLEKQGMKGLVIDLRDNGGGVLDAATDMLDRLLVEGKLVYTKDKNGEGQEYYCEDQESLDLPMAVLVNGNSASASEIFAGALQDYGAAKLVGTKTFGKGIVQSIFKLGDGTAIKLTTAKYYTPNGRNIHGTGLEPDIEVELDEKVKDWSTAKESEDNQLQKAVETVKLEIK